MTSEKKISCESIKWYTKILFDNCFSAHFES